MSHHLAPLSTKGSEANTPQNREDQTASVVDHILNVLLCVTRITSCRELLTLGQSSLWKQEEKNTAAAYFSPALYLTSSITKRSWTWHCTNRSPPVRRGRDDALRATIWIHFKYSVLCSNETKTWKFRNGPTGWECHTWRSRRAAWHRQAIHADRTDK